MNTTPPAANQIPVFNLDRAAVSERLPSHVVGIGASAGGLEALERLFENMPADTGMAFVVVQHLSPDFKSLTDELLARRTTIPIRQVENGMVVEANAIYLLPPRKDMILADGKLLLMDKDPAQFVALPIDGFFRSLAQDAGSKAVAIILSGTGSDGSRGIRDIHMAGGLVIAQAPESAKFDGMPRSATATGTVDYTLPPEEIPLALVQHGHHPFKVSSRAQAEDVPLSGMEAIFRLLRDSYGIDFSVYKIDTVARRTERRLNGFHLNTVEEYANLLASDPEELNALYKDLLIGVTRFFRDPEAFDLLGRDVLPQLLGQMDRDEEFRVWVAGCATGEEPYSLAIQIQECLDALGRTLPVKIFATDVHRASLDYAGTAIYPAESLAGLSQARRDRFFVPRSDGFQVTAELRKMVVFARHNVLKDAPFTKLDLITCRNMLIYFQPQAQKKTLSLFHFGLKTAGVLFLGPSEGPGELSDEFDVVDVRWKMYRKRRDIRLAPDIRLTNPIGPERLRALGRSNTALGMNVDVTLTSVLDALLDDALPPSLLVNDRREVVRTIAGASRYLNLRDGWLSTDVLEMVDPELRTALAGALPRAFKEMTPVVYKGLRLHPPEGERLVTVTVKPVRGRRSATPYALIRLEELGKPLPLSEFAQEIHHDEASREQVLSLEGELRSTKENLQAMIEELETSNEELQATNEELVAANEELQSTNEELLL